MARPKRYYWMKLKESFMTSETVDYFMSQPEGANYVVLYQMLCLKTINTEGKMVSKVGEMLIPYNVEKIQRDCKWFSVDTIRVALKLYQAVGLIYEEVDGTLVLADHKNLVGSESDSTERVRRFRENKAQALPEPVTDGEQEALHCNADVTGNVTLENRDKRLEIRDKDIQREDREGEDETVVSPPAPPRQSIDYESIRNLYNSICVSLPQCRVLSDARKKAIKARFSAGYTAEDFQRLFELAEASSFLRGKNDRNWTADFDWLIKDANMAKVFDGKYEDKGGNHYGKDPSGSGSTQRYGTYL